MYYNSLSDRESLVLINEEDVTEIGLFFKKSYYSENIVVCTAMNAVHKMFLKKESSYESMFAKLEAAYKVTSASFMFAFQDLFITTDTDLFIKYLGTLIAEMYFRANHNSLAYISVGALLSDLGIFRQTYSQANFNKIRNFGAKTVTVAGAYDNIVRTFELKAYSDLPVLRNSKVILGGNNGQNYHLVNQNVYYAFYDNHFDFIFNLSVQNNTLYFRFYRRDSRYLLPLSFANDSVQEFLDVYGIKGDAYVNSVPVTNKITRLQGILQLLQGVKVVYREGVKLNVSVGNQVKYRESTFVVEHIDEKKYSNRSLLYLANVENKDEKIIKFIKDVKYKKTKEDKKKNKIAKQAAQPQVVAETPQGVGGTTYTSDQDGIHWVTIDETWFADIANYGQPASQQNQTTQINMPEQH